MKIAIVTVYHPVTNLGSFLQAYALSEYFKILGHTVKFVSTVPNLKSSLKMSLKLIPRRGILHRFQKAFNSITDIGNLNFISPEDVKNFSPEIIIYGSDEIWNIRNPFFLRPVFWEDLCQTSKRIAYGISVGEATSSDFKSHPEIIKKINRFDALLCRDVHTERTLKNLVRCPLEHVVDPTLLLPVEALTKPIKLPKKGYLLVYTYGLDDREISVLKSFAHKFNLKIVSVCFYHLWADENIICSALQLSSLIKGASYVFTTTFHGAIFSLINHSKCAILPVRNKVREITYELRCADRLLSRFFDIDELEETFLRPFNESEFELNLIQLRHKSTASLNKVL